MNEMDTVIGFSISSKPSSDGAPQAPSAKQSMKIRKTDNSFFIITSYNRYLLILP
jgi:hypothetical protein